MGKFAEDEEIEAETLYQLWIAEGLVLSSDKREGETMTQVAESYMKELVHKSMVQVKYEDDIYSERKIISCQLHDIMRDLSMSVAEGEDFYKVIDLTEAESSSPEVTSSSTRQLVVYSDAEGLKNIKNDPFLAKKYNQGRARSVLLCLSNDFIPIMILGLHFESFRLLRVFVLQGVDFLQINLGKILGRLVHVRYLSLAGSNLVKFPSIQKLEQLQTLKLDSTRFSFMYLPSSLPRNILSNFGHLRHLYLPQHPDNRKNIKLGFDGLSKLETLENFDTRWCEVKDLPKLISLQKLLLRIHGNDKEVEEMIKYLSSYSGRCLIVYIFIWDDPMFEYGGADIWRQLFWNHKYNLQELHITGKVPELVQIFGQQQLDNTYVDVSLIHITSLDLQFSCFMEDPMPVLERFPMLRELVLFSAYAGMEMVCSVEGFPKLTYLQLHSLPNLEKWRAEEGSMPILEYLTIDGCPKLKEPPERLKDLPRAPSWWWL